MNHSLNKKKYLAFLVTLLFIILSLLTFQGFECNPDPDSLVIPGTPSAFDLDEYPALITVEQGETVSASVGIKRNSGSDAVYFWLQSNGIYTFPIPGITYGFNPNPIPANSEESILTIEADVNTTTGDYIVSLAYGKKMGESKGTRTLTIKVSQQTPDFSLSLFSGGIGILQGRSQTITVDINRTGGHSAPIDLSIHSVPAGVTFSYDPNPVPGNKNSSQLTLTIGETVVPGSYTLDLTGDDGTNQHFVQLQLNVAEPYTLSTSPDSISIAQGQSGLVDINITKSGGFTDSIVLTVEGGIIGQGPALIDTTFNPNPLLWNESTSQLTLTVGAAVASGTYPLTVKGTVGTMVKSAGLQLVVP